MEDCLPFTNIKFKEVLHEKGIVSLLLTSVMTASMILSGCGGSTSTEGPAESQSEAAEVPASDSASEESVSTEAASEDSASAPAANHDEELTLEVYDVAANYQGLQTGWFGKILKDEFNLVLNIIAPQVSGDGEALYQTRTAAGNLGDIILLDNADMVECVDVGLVADISGDIQNYPNLMKYWEQIEMFNEGIGDGVWAIPTEMNTNGPTAYMSETAGTHAQTSLGFLYGAGKAGAEHPGRPASGPCGHAGSAFRPMRRRSRLRHHHVEGLGRHFH